MSAAHIITLVALVVVLVCDLVFIVLNHAWTAWRSNPWGRHVMFFSYVLAAILSLGMARLVFGDYPGREWILAVLYVLLAGAMIQRVGLLVHQHLTRPR